MLNSLCVAPVCSHFWRPFWCPNLLQVCFWERSPCLPSRKSGIFEFCLHFPLQNGVLPRFLPVCQKRSRKLNFRVFLTFLGLKTCQNFLAIYEHAYFFMTNQNMLSFSQNYAFIKSERQVARRIGQKSLFFKPKITKLQKVSQIFWNLGWVSSIKCYVRLRKPWPRSKVYLALFSSLMPSSTWPSSSWFLLGTPYFLTSSDMPCFSTYFSHWWPSPAFSPRGYLSFQAKIHDQLGFLVQVLSTWFSSSWQLAVLPSSFGAPWWFVDLLVIYSSTPNT